MNDDLKQYLDERFTALATKEDVAGMHQSISECTTESAALHERLYRIEEHLGMGTERIIW